MASRVSVEPATGRAVVQFAAVGKTADTDTFPVLSDSTTVHQLSIIDEPINSWKTCTHTFRAKDRAYLDKVLHPLISREGGFIMFRMGLVAGDRSVWRPWEKHIIVSYRASLEPDSESGPLVSLKTADILWAMFRIGQVKAHAGAISDVVLAMWKSYGETSAVIEKTKQVGISSNQAIHYQSFKQDDFTFIKEHLLSRAANADGVTGYRFFVRDNALHFHSAGFGSQDIKRIDYGLGSTGFSLLNISDRQNELAATGALGRKMLVSDPTTGEAHVLVADAAKTVRLASARPEVLNYDYAIGHVGPNLIGEEFNANQGKHASQASEIYMAEFSATKCLALRVGDVIELVVADSRNGASVHTGNWLLNRATHTLESGSLTTRYIGTRGESNSKTDSQILATGDGFAIGPKQVGGIPVQTVMAANGVRGDNSVKTESRIRVVVSKSE